MTKKDQPLLSASMIEAAVNQVLHDEASKIFAEATKARRPLYVEYAECVEYLEDTVTGIRIKVPQWSIEMRKRSDGVWTVKRKPNVD